MNSCPITTNYRMALVLILLYLLQVASAEMTITTLTGNLYIEDIGKIHQYHETWTLIIGVNVTNTEERFNSIINTLAFAKQVCDQQCNEAHEISLVES